MFHFYGNSSKRKFSVRVLFTAAVILLCICSLQPSEIFTSAAQNMDEEELRYIVKNIFAVRNRALLNGNVDTIEELYNTDLRNGLWAFIHEGKKVEYIKNWSEKQGAKFTDINSEIIVRWFRCGEQSATVSLLVSTSYKYIYEDRPETENLMRIGTYHELKLARNDENWLITREWYTDPFADSLDLEELNPENKDFILSNEARDFSDLNERRINAVKYADQFCGAAYPGENGYTYNPKYKNYNSLGGDCANFVSQVLYEGGKFRKTYTWSYQKDGSRAWLKAQGLKDFMLNSGRGSLIAYGSYDKVLKSSYKLLPGDIVAYEKKGEVAHVSVVTGADSRGYSLVNCHNTDRYRVPWDLGFSSSRIRFYLIRVHY